MAGWVPDGQGGWMYQNDGTGWKEKPTDSSDPNVRASAAQDRANANYADQSQNPTAYRDYNGNVVTGAPNLEGIAYSLGDPRSSGALAFQYGGQIGGAAAAEQRYQGLADQAQSRGLIQGNYGQADASRGSQSDALGMYRDAALGRGPSAAQAQLQQGVDRSIAGNQALANSARGGSLALAQGRLAASAQNANAVGGYGAQAAQLRAQEQQAGLAGYGNLGTNIRQQDIGQAGALADQGLQSRGQNDTAGYNYNALGNSVATTQLGAQQNRITALNQANGVAVNAANQAQANANQAQANTDANTRGYVQSGAGAVGGLITLAALANHEKVNQAPDAPQPPQVLGGSRAQYGVGQQGFAARRNFLGG